MDPKNNTCIIVTAYTGFSALVVTGIILGSNPNLSNDERCVAIVLCGLAASSALFVGAYAIHRRGGSPSDMFAFTQQRIPALIIFTFIAISLFYKICLMLYECLWR